MVDVGDKDVTARVATASGKIYMSKEAYETIKSNSAKKGPVLQTAVVAAIMGAKKTPDIIPMCHPINISGVDVDIEDLCSGFGFELSATVRSDYKTGVEMEALSSVSIGLLTIYDMIKAIDKGMVIEDIKLLKKSGGKSGDFSRNVGKRIAVAFSGLHNSGKTTLIEKLIKELAPTHKVVALKHDPKDKAVFDSEGKDSRRFYESGAETFIFSDKKSAYFSHSPKSMDEMIKTVGDFDYLFLEGLRGFELPRIYVARDEFDSSYLEFCDCVASDKEVVCDKEVLDLNNISKILEWIDKNGKRA